MGASPFGRRSREGKYRDGNTVTNVTGKSRDDVMVVTVVTA